MCGVCGCGEGETTIEGHSHHHSHNHGVGVDVEEKILSARTGEGMAARISWLQNCLPGQASIRI